MRALLLLALAGCPWVTPDDLETRLDVDGDGFVAEDDCAETDADWPKVFYTDADGDGFGDPLQAQAPTCTDPGEGFSLIATDCDDARADVYPGASEWCDGADNDCDESTDEDLVFADWYRDRDGDGYGFDDPADATDDPPNACVTPGEGWVDDDGDCDDTDETVFPAATERCDGQINACGGTTLRVEETDGDGDGWVPCTLDAGGWDGPVAKLGDDCDDEEAAVHPDATEACDGIVNRCGDTLSADETDDDPDGPDGYVECTIDGLWLGDEAVEGGDDCDDADGTVHPDAEEVCGDGVVNDCGVYDGSCDLPSPISDADALATFASPSAAAPFVAAAAFSDGGVTPALALGVPSDGSGRGAVFVFESPLPLGALDGGDADTVVIGATSTSGLGAVLAGDVRYPRLLVAGAEADSRWPWVLDGATLAGDLPPAANPAAELASFASFTGHQLALSGADTGFVMTWAALGDFGATTTVDVVTPQVCAYDDPQGDIAYTQFGNTQMGAARAGGLFEYESGAPARMGRFGDVQGGDGRDDLLLAAEGGLVYLVPHPPTGQSIQGPIDLDQTGTTRPGVRFVGNPADGFGHAAWPIGDFDGDGAQDLVITAPEMESGAGGAFLLFGPFGPQETIDAADVGALTGGAFSGVEGLVLVGDATDALGEMDPSSAPYIGDIDDDGFDDLAIGLPGAMGGRGKVTVLYGTDDPIGLCDGPPDRCTVHLGRINIGEIRGVQVEGGPPGGAFGTVVVGLDADGDGISEILVLAPSAAPPSAPNTAYLVSLTAEGP